MKISHLNKIHFSLDLLKERSAEYPGNIITSLILSQNNALFGKNIAMGIGLSLFHNSLRKRVSVKRGAGVGVHLFFFFLENAALGLGLWLG